MVKEPEEGNLHAVVISGSPWRVVSKAQVEAEVREIVGVGERKEAAERRGIAGAEETIGLGDMVQDTESEISKKGSRIWMTSKWSMYMVAGGEVE